MIETIKITLSDGRRVTLKSPSILETGNRREIALVFNTGQIYRGFVEAIDKYGDIHLTRPGASSEIGLPLKALIGWFYE